MKKETKNFLSISSSQSGFSVLGTLFGISATAMVFGTMLNYSGKFRALHSKLRVAKSSTEIKDSFELSLGERFREMLDGDCFSPTLDFANLSVNGGDALFNAEEIIPESYPADVVKNCKKFQIPDKDTSDKVMFFCGKISGDPSEPRNSFLRYDSYVRVGAKILRISDFTGASCSEYMASKQSHVIFVYYAVNWQKERKSKVVNFRRKGEFYVAPN